MFFTAPQNDDSDEIVNYLAETWQGPILVADMSISLTLAEKLDKRGTDITILDHHKSAIPLSKFDWCLIDEENTAAGGKLLFNYLLSQGASSNLNHYKDLVDAADDYDRWIKDIPISDELMALHAILGQETFISRFLKNPKLEFTECEKYVLAIEKRKQEEYIARKKEEAFYRMIEVDGQSLKVAVVRAGNYQSPLGNQLCTDPACGADIAVLVNANSVSLRASPTCPVDLSAVAKSHGGGGHMKSSGVSLNSLIREDFAEFVFSKIKWS